MKNIFIFLLGSLLLLSSCQQDEEPLLQPAPTADNAQFSITVDPDNPNLIHFTGQPDMETWYTHWSFGDGASAEGLEVSRLYPLSGEYEVRFKMFTEGGSAFSTQTITINVDLIGPNLVANASLDDESDWTVLPITGGVDVTFQGGTAKWTGGGWGHVGIYQAIEVEANTSYQIDMIVSGGGMSDAWFEVYAGKEMPSVGLDYTDGGMRLGLSTWDGCGVAPFEGNFTAISCSNNAGDGTFEFETAGLFYLVIRGGGGDYGEGLTLDDVSVRKL